MTTVSGYRPSYSPFEYSFQQASVSQPQLERAQQLLSFLDAFEQGGGNFSGGAYGLRPPRGLNQYLLNDFLAGLNGRASAMTGQSSAAEMMLRSLAMFEPNVAGTNTTELAKGSGPDPKEPDKWAVSSCRGSSDNPTNLNDSPLIQLALNEILDETTDFDQVAKKLKDEYGIDAESTTITTEDGTQWRALKFKNGGVFADGNGNGIADKGDYNFSGALDDIKQKYGITAEQFDDFFAKAKSAGATPEELEGLMNRLGTNGDDVAPRAVYGGGYGDGRGYNYGNGSIFGGAKPAYGQGAYGMQSTPSLLERMAAGARGTGSYLGGAQDALQGYISSLAAQDRPRSELWPMDTVQQIFAQAELYAQLRSKSSV